MLSGVYDTELSFRKMTCLGCQVVANWETGLGRRDTGTMQWHATHDHDGVPMASCENDSAENVHSKNNGTSSGALVELVGCAQIE